MSDYQNRVLECALQYIKLGWKVLPLHTIRNGQCACGKAGCSSPGKHPITFNGVKDASSDPEVIKRWFDNGIPFNIGIATGTASGLVVLDIDPKNGGDESVKQFDIPPTLEVTTGSGGKHYYFALPAGQEIRNSAGKLAAGLDVRGENGYVVAPPSVHASGKNYQWDNDYAATSLAAWPQELKIDNVKLTNKKNDPALTDTEIIPEGQRNDRLASIAGAMRRQGCSQDAIFNAMITINQRQCRPPLGYEELKRIAESISGYQPQPQDGNILTDDQHDTIAKAFETASVCKHKHQTETWVVMADRKYQIVDERELKKQIRRFASDCKVRKKIRTDSGFTWRNDRIKVNPHTVNGIAEALSALDGVWLPPEKQSPAWLKDAQGRPNPQKLIPLENGLLDVSGGKPRLMELTEDFFTVNYLPVVYDPKADCPKWKTFLGHIFQKKQLSSEKTEWDPQADDFVEVYEMVPDELSISILQEFMGLLLTPITRFQKILGIVGPKRSGKGTIGRILRAVAGGNNVASPTLSSLTCEHGLQSLYNKTIALIGDASISGGNADTIRAVERLKSISGEDPQQINPKGKAYIEVDRLGVRFVIMSNELQKLTDPTGALAGRFIYLITTQSFFGNEDVYLEEKLLTELPGIFNWAVEGLMRLLGRGKFLESDAGKEAKAMAEELGSPVIAFVREWCEVGGNRQTRSQELYEAYKRWANDAGRSQMGRTRFYEEFQRAYPDCPRARSRVGSESNPVFVFNNIGLQPEHRIGYL